jgi:hypothetical protein
MAGADASTGISVDVLMERHEVVPVRADMLTAVGCRQLAMVSGHDVRNPLKPLDWTVI